jgi:homoserine/homoserine lactone efflux protein
MTIEIWFAFLIACILISVTPGAGAVNTMSNGMVYGVRHSLPAIMGLQLGLAAQFLIVGIGLGALLASSDEIFTLVKWIGVVYLLWLGIQKWRQAPLTISRDNECDLNYSKRFWQGALVNLTNPKATIFLVALLPQFIDLNAPHIPQFSIMAITMFCVDIIVMLGYAALATTIARWMKSDHHQRRINRLFGGMFMLAAGLMASYQRT